LVTILAIFIIPLLAFAVLSKQSESVSAKPSIEQTQISGKPQVIKFTSAMCRDCQTMNGIFKDIFPKYQNDIVLTEIQVQNKSSFNRNMMRKYNVDLVPTIIFINSDGSVAERIEGAISKEETEMKLKGLK
jgi:thiol:disulfide interchange protein